MKRRRHFALAAALTLATLVGTASSSFANTDSDLASAENSYAALDYQTALNAAESVLAQPGISHDVLARATRVAALSSSALGKADNAKQYFTQLLEYDPSFKIDGRLGPRFSEPFAEARGYWSAQGGKPGLAVTLSIAYLQPGRLRFVTQDPLNVVKKVTIGYRWAPDRNYTVSTNEPGTKEIETAPGPEGSTRFEYYVRALDAKDRSIFEEGAAETPKSSVVEIPQAAPVAEEKKSVFASPIFWTVTGVVVAGVVVGGFFLFRPTEYKSSTTTRGSLGAMCGTQTCS